MAMGDGQKGRGAVVQAPSRLDTVRKVAKA